MPPARRGAKLPYRWPARAGTSGRLLGFERLAHFNCERIPERVVHAKGVEAQGKLTVIHGIMQYTCVKLFSAVGNKCDLLVRFSTVADDKGSADSARDRCDFSLKFYTKGGNRDMVGNNTPVSLVKDGQKSPDFIHSQKRNPCTNLRSKTVTGPLAPTAQEPAPSPHPDE